MALVRTFGKDMLSQPSRLLRTQLPPSACPHRRACPSRGPRAWEWAGTLVVGAQQPGLLAWHVLAEGAQKHHHRRDPGYCGSGAASEVRLLKQRLALQHGPAERAR